MCHLLYLRSRIGQTSVVALNVLPLFIEEQFINLVPLDTPRIFLTPLSRWIFCRITMENIKVQLLVVME